MPRKISNPKPRDAEYKGLLDALVHEIREPRNTGQPIVFERHMDLTDAVHVFVVWDRFAEIREDQRSSMVLEAYEVVMGAEFRGRITLATGVTIPEAVDLELLPYGIVTARRRNDGLTLEQYRDALIAEGASTLRNPDQPELRFETLDDAVAAVARLQERMPGSHWVVLQEVGR